MTIQIYICLYIYLPYIYICITYPILYVKCSLQIHLDPLCTFETIKGHNCWSLHLKLSARFKAPCPAVISRHQQQHQQHYHQHHQHCHHHCSIVSTQSSSPSAAAATLLTFRSWNLAFMKRGWSCLDCHPIGAEWQPHVELQVVHCAVLCCSVRDAWLAGC